MASVDLAGKLGGERLIDHAVAFEPRLAGEAPTPL